MDVCDVDLVCVVWWLDEVKVLVKEYVFCMKWVVVCDVMCDGDVMIV